MLKKIAVVALASLALGGCSLKDMLKTNSAVMDEKQESVVATSTPAPTYMVPDKDLDSMKQNSSSTDVTSLETDINGTTILQEDFSDLN
ncbi:hypothetical protein KBD75_04040 [Candidatus Woesebacteria bacterium]|nr:hypothetical protein [Candidatus Woesebacteria bacterium]